MLLPVLSKQLLALLRALAPQTARRRRWPVDVFSRLDYPWVLRQRSAWAGIGWEMGQLVLPTLGLQGLNLG